MLALGPLGAASPRREPGRRALLVGGGVGIAPLAILQDALGGSGATRLLGFRDGERAARRGAAATARAWRPTTAPPAITAR